MVSYNFNEIIKKYLSGNATPEEEALLLKFYDDYKKNEPHYTLTEEEKEMMLHAFKSSSRFKSDITNISTSPKSGYLTKFLRSYYGRAAVILFMLTIGGGVLWKFVNNNKAKKSISYNSIVTARGEVKQITLPDSSIVILNALSKLDYRKNFIENREIFIEGQAYFKVIHDNKHPFFVKTKNELYALDIGTEFVVNNYTNSPDIRISVISGQVLVGKKDSVFGNLVQGQEIRYNRETGNVTRRQESDVNRFLSWNTGEWYYANMSFSDLKNLMDIGYNIHIENATGNIGKKDTIGVDMNFSKTQKADEIINIFSIAAGCHYKWIAKDTVRLY